MPTPAEPVTSHIVGFMQHLRLNGFVVGPAETQTALEALGRADIADRDAVRLGLKTLLTSRHEEWARFDELFEAYWSRCGRARQRLEVADRRSDRTPRIWADHLPESGDAAGASGADDRRTTESGRLAASLSISLARTDLRHVANPQEIAEAERLALRLARAMAWRLSRRLRHDNNGARLDLRRTIHRSIPHGGEPIELARKDRPDRPVRIVLLLDVSGSMKPYSRFFLQFMKGLVSAWRESDAYLFHTRLVRVTDAIRERDPMAAMMRLSLMAEGFGGGTRLGDSLKVFNDLYAKRALNSRSVFFIVSDGYDTGTPAHLARELQRLKKRVRRLVWLNPLLGWRSYEPVTRAMAAALPFIDHFAAAHTLEALAAVEGDLHRL
jgi:uncharacterized protein with von Willebrand factor type A (vWA) domain